MSKTFDSFEDIEFIDFYTEEDSPIKTKFHVKVDEGFFKTTYTLKARVDGSNTLDKMMAEEKEEQDGLFSEEDLESVYRSMLAQVDLKWKLTLPVEAEEQNADNVSGKTLTWEIGMMEDNKFHAKAEQIHLINIILTVVAVVGALGALAVIALFALRKRNHQEIKKTKMGTCIL